MPTTCTQSCLEVAPARRPGQLSGTSGHLLELHALLARLMAASELATR